MHQVALKFTNPHVKIFVMTIINDTTYTILTNLFAAENITVLTQFSSGFIKVSNTAGEWN